MTPTIPIEQARRLALHAQGLAAPPRPATAVADVVARIGCLQLDPVGVVARSPLLVLRARLNGGSHDSHARALERAAYRERRLFDYWCHEASLCHVDDLPLHRWAMRTYVERLPPKADAVRRWLAVNADFAEHTVDALRSNGPLRARELEDRSEAAWSASTSSGSRSRSLSGPGRQSPPVNAKPITRQLPSEGAQDPASRRIWSSSALSVSRMDSTSSARMFVSCSRSNAGARARTPVRRGNEATTSSEIH